VLLAVVPPIVQDDGDERRRNDFRAGFIDGCIRSGSPDVSAAVTRRYCECMFETLSEGRDADELELMATRTSRALESGQQPPPEVVSAAETCSRRAS
jgi:hypothetical protein